LNFDAEIIVMYKDVFEKEIYPMGWLKTPVWAQYHAAELNIKVATNIGQESRAAVESSQNAAELAFHARRAWDIVLKYRLNHTTITLAGVKIPKLVFPPEYYEHTEKARRYEQ
jgi:hypothetical protein